MHQDANYQHKALFIFAPTIFHFIKMSEFSLLNGVIEVILVTFEKIGLSFSVYNKRNYLSSDDVYGLIASSHKKIGFFSSPVSHLITYKWKPLKLRPILYPLHPVDPNGTKWGSQPPYRVMADYCWIRTKLIL